MRPVLVIALGRTGQRVMMYLKNDLQEIGRGELPPNVRLLAFNIVPHDQSSEAEDAAQVGAVRLVEDLESIDLGGTCYDVSQATTSGERKDTHGSILRHRPSETQASDYLRSLSLAELVRCAGAGKTRHLGRLAPLEDLIRGYRQVSMPIRRAAKELQAEVQRTNTKLEVIIVASLVGGNGAGMLIDVAKLSRQIARDVVHSSHVIRVFAVLPDTDPWASEHRKSQVCAALREIDRFMGLNGREDSTPVDIVYGGKLTMAVEARPFDEVYLFDATRSHQHLENVRAEGDLCRAAADYICTVLGCDAGTRITLLADNQ